MNSCIDRCFSEHWQTSLLIWLHFPIGFIASNVSLHFPALAGKNSIYSACDLREDTLLP
jgi:hypothetical protein